MSRIIDPQSPEQRRQRTDRDVVYIGYRQRGRAVVEKLPNHEQLTPHRSLKVANHSPTGFEWGYGGSGPAQLALALLLNYTDDEEFALTHYTQFKNEVVSQLECTGPNDRWRLTGGDIEAVVGAEADELIAP
ncbi:DUF6166 domain-containing protein [Haloquadratum walsbyi]|uniref:DUF6166 domain-containing protein n=1 Tax=Haloquadratum walsbyi TaxID=293091 RepID=UPI0015F64B00|nr:DUF6166 domain-containing protein [Haloquadratum walsbyi]